MTNPDYGYLVASIPKKDSDTAPVTSRYHRLVRADHPDEAAQKYIEDNHPAATLLRSHGGVVIVGIPTGVKAYGTFNAFAANGIRIYEIAPGYRPTRQEAPVRIIRNVPQDPNDPFSQTIMSAPQTISGVRASNKG